MAMVMALPPSPNAKMPETSEEPELAVACAPMVLLRTPGVDDPGVAALPVPVDLNRFASGSFGDLQ